MSSTTRDLLIQSLVQLSHLYPEMRLGQLFSFLGSLAGDDAPGLCQDFDDETLLGAAERHVKRRCQQLGVERNDDRQSLGAERQETLTALVTCTRASAAPLGLLVHQVAEADHVSAYDIEDEHLKQRLESREEVHANHP